MADIGTLDERENPFTGVEVGWLPFVCTTGWGGWWEKLLRCAFLNSRRIHVSARLLQFVHMPSSLSRRIKSHLTLRPWQASQTTLDLSRVILMWPKV